VEIREESILKAGWNLKIKKWQNMLLWFLIIKRLVIKGIRIVF